MKVSGLVARKIVPDRRVPCAMHKFTSNCWNSMLSAWTEATSSKMLWWRSGEKTPAYRRPYQQIVEIAFGTSNCRDRRVLPSLSFFSNLWTSLISCGFFWYLWPSISTSIGIYWNTSLLLWRPFLAEAEKNPSKEKKESHKGAAKVALMCFYIIYIHLYI